MPRSPLAILAAAILAASILAASACDNAPDVPTVVAREAPDVPWPAVTMDGPVGGPDEIGAIVSGCFDGAVLVADQLGDESCPSCTASVNYVDDAPDGDDRQRPTLCLSWEAHLDRQDCVRRGLIKAGLVPVPVEDAP